MYYRLTLALLQRGFLRMGTRFWLLLGSVAACAWLLMINLSPVYGAVTLALWVAIKRFIEILVLHLWSRTLLLAALSCDFNIGFSVSGHVLTLIRLVKQAH